MPQQSLGLAAYVLQAMLLLGFGLMRFLRHEFVIAQDCVAIEISSQPFIPRRIDSRDTDDLMVQERYGTDDLPVIPTRHVVFLHSSPVHAANLHAMNLRRS